jgi:hypothetical protein
MLGQTAIQTEKKMYGITYGFLRKIISKMNFSFKNNIPVMCTEKYHNWSESNLKGKCKGKVILVL